MQDFIQLIDPERATTMVVAFLPRVVAAIIVLVGFWALARLTRPALTGILKRADFAEALVSLLVDNLYRFALMGVGLVMAAGQLGIDVAAALAGLGVAGIAVGFAAQDSLANTIAGFLIFWDKPFQPGDFITTQDRYGEVHNITMRTTRIRTVRNTYVVIPNRVIIEQPMVNHSLYGDVRVDVPLGIAYKEDVSAARQILLDVATRLDHVLSSPEPALVLKELGDSSVNLEFRLWIREARMEQPVRFAALEAAKRALDEAGIEIPFPHLQLFVEDVREPVWSELGRVASNASSRP